jgi:hypothetical protein
MKRGREAVALAAVVLVSGIVAGSPAGAGEPAPTGTISVDPPSGQPGNVFLFSGEGCVSEAGPGVMEVSVFFRGDLIVRLDPAFVGVDDGGSWNVGMNPNGFMSNDEAVGTWEVTGTCFDAETWQVVADYQTATFEVVAPSAPPATDPPAADPPALDPPAAPSSTSTTPAPVAPRRAEPATPVTADPDFTG